MSIASLIFLLFCGTATVFRGREDLPISLSSFPFYAVASGFSSNKKHGFVNQINTSVNIVMNVAQILNKP